MQVAFRDPRQKITELVTLNRRRADDKAAILERKLDRGIVCQPEVGRKGLRNSQGQTVTPFLNLGFHIASVSTKKIRFVETSVK